MTGRYATTIEAWTSERMGGHTSPISITSHAIERCRQRVAPALNFVQTQTLLTTMVAQGRVRPTPRKWTRKNTSPRPGLRFVYWSELPDVCGLVVNRTLVTVLTRRTCKSLRLGNDRQSHYAMHKRRQQYIDEDRPSMELVEDNQ